MVITTATIGKDDNENDNYIEEPDISSSMKLIAVHVSITEDFISSFQFELCDNKSLILSPLIGHKTNRENTWTVPKGEYVSKIILYYEHFLHGIVFETNKGSMSPIFGSQTFEKKEIEIKGSLVSFGGTYSNYITSVYFIYYEDSEIEESKKEELDILENIPNNYIDIIVKG